LKHFTKNSDIPCGNHCPATFSIVSLSSDSDPQRLSHIQLTALVLGSLGYSTLISSGLLRFWTVVISQAQHNYTGPIALLAVFFESGYRCLHLSGCAPRFVTRQQPPYGDLFTGPKFNSISVRIECLTE
jgi:hypothetical protein